MWWGWEAERERTRMKMCSQLLFSLRGHGAEGERAAELQLKYSRQQKVGERSGRRGWTTLMFCIVLAVQPGRAATVSCKGRMKSFDLGVRCWDRHDWVAVGKCGNKWGPFLPLWCSCGLTPGNLPIGSIQVLVHICVCVVHILQMQIFKMVIIIHQFLQFPLPPTYPVMVNSLTLSSLTAGKWSRWRSDYFGFQLMHADPSPIPVSISSSLCVFRQRNCLFT